jgi:hypothetical protein
MFFHNLAFAAPTTQVDYKNPQLFGKLTTDAGVVIAGGQPLIVLTTLLKW